MRILISTLIFLFFISCQNQKTIDFVLNKYTEKSNSIKNITYKVVRIDTFSKDFIMNRRGNVLIEKNINDSLFGMSFYARSSFVNKDYLYDKNKVFEISKRDSTYIVEKGYYGFLGSPGGQLVSKNLLYLDDDYKSVSLEENKNNYTLQYSFDNDTILNIENINKKIIIDKHTFLPSKMVMTSERSGEKRSQYFIFESIKINDEVATSIEMYKNQLLDFKITPVKKNINNSQIGYKIKEKGLFTLKNEFVEIQKKFPALISFWEPWCAPCIRSLPKIDKLRDKYDNKLYIIGITTDNTASVINLLFTKKIKFLNLKGTENIHNNYEITSFPTYFLVDKNGIIVKEYFYYSNKIETDIKELLD